jgi:hypothetical protein
MVLLTDKSSEVGHLQAVQSLVFALWKFHRMFF